MTQPEAKIHFISEDARRYRADLQEAADRMMEFMRVREEPITETEAPSWGRMRTLISDIAAIAKPKRPWWKFWEPK